MTNIEATVSGGTSIINLFSGITEKSAKSFINDFKYLEKISSSIQIRINSSGGSVLHGWSIVDTILNSSVPTEGVVVGVAASMASVILAVVNKPKMMEYTSIMVHNPFYTNGKPDANDKQLETMRGQLIRIYSLRWGKSQEEVEAMMDGNEGEDGTWMNCEDAIRFGVIGKDGMIGVPAQIRNEYSSIAASAIERKKMPAMYQQIITRNSLQKLPTIEGTMKEIQARNARELLKKLSNYGK